MTIEQAINDLMDASRTIAEVAESESDEANRINAQNVADDCKQIAAWLRELQERRKAPEIVRCTECRYFEDSDLSGYCNNPETYAIKTDADFGCILGERSTDADD